MQIQITGIENGIVTCEILSGDGGVIDIARQWFAGDISIGDQIEVDLEKNMLSKEL